MNSLQSLAGVCLAGAFLVLFGFANANGADLDSTLTTAVVTTALAGGVAYDAGRAVERRKMSQDPGDDEEFDPNA